MCGARVRFPIFAPLPAWLFVVFLLRTVPRRSGALHIGIEHFESTLTTATGGDMW